MPGAALDGLTEITGPIGIEGTTVFPSTVLYNGAKAQWRNVITSTNPLLPGFSKTAETALVPLRINPDNGALWVDNTASKYLTKKSGKFTGSTSVTVSSEIVLNNSTSKAIYLSYASYQLTQEAEIWFSYGNNSVNGGTGQSTPSSSSFLRNIAPAKGIIAKDFGDSRVLRGSTQFSLWLNVAASAIAPDIIWNLFYTLEDEFYGG